MQEQSTHLQLTTHHKATKPCTQMKHQDTTHIWEELMQEQRKQNKRAHGDTKEHPSKKSRISPTIQQKCYNKQTQMKRSRKYN